MGIRKPFTISVPNANINTKKKSVSWRNRTPKVINASKIQSNPLCPNVSAWFRNPLDKNAPDV